MTTTLAKHDIPNQVSTSETLNRRVALLYQEQGALRIHHDGLLAYGIGSQTTEIYQRLVDINAELHAINDTLRAIGAIPARPDRKEATQCPR